MDHRQPLRRRLQQRRHGRGGGLGVPRHGGVLQTKPSKAQSPLRSCWGFSSPSRQRVWCCSQRRSGLDQLLASIETPLDDDDLPPHSQPTGGLGKAAHDAAAASWTSYQPGETRHKTGHFPAEVNIKPGTRHTEPQHELRKPTEMFCPLSRRGPPQDVSSRPRTGLGSNPQLRRFREVRWQGGSTLTMQMSLNLVGAGQTSVVLGCMTGLRACRLPALAGLVLLDVLLSEACPGVPLSCTCRC